ncbi:MAG: glycosyltransferase family 4 protein [Candidatus Bathyarchaeota archaeon]|nr:glycosyltransferase family 4 protein [Candidatus Bathyarchaeota archaeon]
MQRMKILMVGPFPPTVGGITSCMLNIMNSLKESYYFLPFTTGRPTVGMRKDATDYSIILKMKPAFLFKSAMVTFYHVFSYPFTLLTESPSIVHINATDYLNFFENSVYLFVAKMLRKKSIMHIHATYFEAFYDGSNAIFKAVIRKTLNAADRLIVLSPNTQAFFTKIAPSSKISVIPNTAEIPAKLVNEKFSERDAKVRVLFLGSEEAKRKGFFDVIKAIPIVLEKSKVPVVFLFAGIYDSDKLRAINETKAQCKCVECLGYLDNSEMLLVRQSSDIYTLPSYAEGLPCALLEAMAAGLPVVTTTVGSIPEVVEDNINGFLIEPGDVTLLAEKIVVLANDSALRQIIGVRNIDKIKKLFSPESIMRELNEVYRDL